jgi:hypothetical protein
MGSHSALLKPGETGLVEIQTSAFGYHFAPKSILFEPGQRFGCRDGGRAIAEVEAMVE